MDEQTKNLIKRKLQKIGDVRLSKEHLIELREEIAKGTGHNKFAPFKNIRKWIAMVKKDMKKDEAVSKKEKPSVPGAHAPVTERREPEAPMAPVSDRVFIQTIGYEIAGIRRSMDRISTQLNEIEKKLSAAKKE